jgi:hypothetical protein
MNANELKKIVRAYDILYDEVMEYAQKRYLPAHSDRYYLIDLEFNFYKEDVISVTEKDALVPEYFDRKTFSVDDFLQYYNKKIKSTDE